MRKRFIYICSPCRGDMEKNITKAQGYCREAAELWPDVVPIAPRQIKLYASMPDL